MSRVALHHSCPSPALHHRRRLSFYIRSNFQTVTMPPFPFTPASPLFARAIGASTAHIACPRPKPNEVGDPLFGKDTIDLHQFMIYVSAPCLLLTILSSVFLSWRHLHRYTSPQEQRQILRIINLPVFYSLFNFLALTFTLDYMYIEPLGGAYEAFTVAALFFLTLEWVAPDGTDREKYFDNLPNKGRRGHVTPGGSLVWFQVSSAAQEISHRFMSLTQTPANMELHPTIPFDENRLHHHPDHHAVLRRFLRKLFQPEACPSMAHPCRLHIHRRSPRRDHQVLRTS